ncbi:hypothetical protein BDSB_11460 [Burkholderia dolosa PC543]|nr:hypothetical protein BDSB_11460 [Burkholderia dolosa PC543]
MDGRRRMRVPPAQKKARRPQAGIAQKTAWSADE